VDKLASVAWVKNHYKWIVWKLASMERMFPQDYANQYLTAARVLSQLKYRYEREINQAQRPAIKKLLERDEFAGRYMVLCVSAIRYRGKDGVFVPAKPVRDKGAGNPFPPLRPPSDPTHKDVSNEGANEQEADYEALGGNCAVIEVTDGWYGVNALLDEYMTALLRRGKIFVGLKLRVFGATITGSGQFVKFHAAI
jgi:breast cancer 2 susceptibility protein